MSTTTPPNLPPTPPTRTAQTSQPILKELAERFSPYHYSESPIPAPIVASLFEAARWAPSAFNAQPWHYLVGDIRQPETHAKLLACLVDANQVWAQHAPLLVIAVARDFYPHNNKPNIHAWHDVGLANMSLVTEATRHGLHTHMMAGIHYDKIKQEFSLPEGFAPICAIAIGYPEARELPEAYEKRATAPRQRKALTEMLLTGPLPE